MKSKPRLKDKFVAYVDILGFQSKVEATHKDDAERLCELLDHCSKLAQTVHTQSISSHGPMICPESRYLDQNLDYEVTQTSDSVVVSSEISPAGLVNLLHHISSCIYGLFMQGIMVRGYITRGSIYHSGQQYIGPGYLKALEGEKRVSAFCTSENDDATPFVEIDPVISQYLKDENDWCASTMFDRWTTHDNHRVTVLFPFFHLARVAGANVGNPETCKRSLKIIRESIELYREKLQFESPESDEIANRKSKHYRNIIGNLLAECKKIEKFLEHSKRPAIKVRYGENFQSVQIEKNE